MVLYSWIRFADVWPLCFLQKIMHTRKRHQDMFQDLNRKLQHAEKEKESPTTDSKVSHIHTQHHHLLEPSSASRRTGKFGSPHSMPYLELMSVHIATMTHALHSTQRATKVPLASLQSGQQPRWRKSVLVSIHIWGLCFLVFVCSPCLCLSFAACLHSQLGTGNQNSLGETEVERGEDRRQG